MKFQMNGALTIGTLDGANIEIMEEVGRENIFIFGLNSDEVNVIKQNGYNPYRYYDSEPDLKHVIDMINSNYFSTFEPEVFRPIFDSLMLNGDQYCLLADFANYIKCQGEVSELFRNKDEWIRKAILNVARSGKFSSDRTIRQYAEEVWGIKPVHIQPPDIEV
jgi:starch phosphorylase